MYLQITNIIKNPDGKLLPFWLIHFRDWLRGMAQIYFSSCYHWADIRHAVLSGCVDANMYNTSANELSYIEWQKLKSWEAFFFPTFATDCRPKISIWHSAKFFKMHKP